MSGRSASFSTKTDGKQHKMKVLHTAWYSGLLKRPLDRTSEEVERASAHLRDTSATEKFHHCLLQQIALYARYDRLDEGVLVIRQGDFGVNWYLVLSGSLAVFTSENIRLKAGPKLCTLTAGASFGEGIFTRNPHLVSVVTLDKVELLWLDYKDMKLLWERHREMMDAAITSLENLPDLNDEMRKLVAGRGDAITLDYNVDPASPICAEPSGNMVHSAWVLRSILLGHHGHMIRDRKYHLRTYKRCMVGCELIDWILDTFPKVDNREHAAGMGQALLEEGVLTHVCKQHPFLDQYLFYRFAEDEDSSGPLPTEADLERAQEDLFDVLTYLAQASPDAALRVILRKLPEDRTADDVEIVFEELLQTKSLQHLSCTVKRELASVIMFEAHSHAGTVLFNQGDEGTSWYIIAKGSVNVSIHGKGVVCVLGEGDDFGKLALVNDAPRAATITLAEGNCHFLRVDKDDFNRILMDVEANTVRLKEHGQDVLVLEKLPIPVDTNGSFHSEYKYSVMAGTPEKMLEYLLETTMDPKKEHQTADTFLDDFLSTHSIFLPDEKLCAEITNHYQASTNSMDAQDDGDFVLSQKKCVVQFVLSWYDLEPDKFAGSVPITQFIENLTKSVAQDCLAYPGLIGDHEALLAIYKDRKSAGTNKVSKMKSFFPGRKNHSKSNLGEGEGEKKVPVKPGDEYIFKVYCADHTYTTVRLPIASSVRDIVLGARDKLCLGQDSVLCEVKSNGERVVFKDQDRFIILSLTLNGRLFIAPREHLDALTPVPEQEGPNISTMPALELMSTRELAVQITLFDWELFAAVPEQEMLTKVMGTKLFPSGISANLDHMLFRFNQLQYWIVTEMVLVLNVSKRVQLLRKFIKLAQHCKELNNYHAFFAITMGLGHLAVSRLSQTWEKLTSKIKKTFSDFEILMEPARNHRAYRQTVSTLMPPVIPYMPLLIKDMTFTNEGNKTHYDNMVNFEKMHMIAQTLRTVRFCRSQPLELESVDTPKAGADVRSYVRNLHVIDNQRILTNLSHKCEPRKG